MEITITLPDSLFETIRAALFEYADIDVTVAELKANQTFMDWLTDDIPSFYEQFGDDFSGLCECVDEMGFDDIDD